MCCYGMNGLPDAASLLLGPFHSIAAVTYGSVVTRRQGGLGLYSRTLVSLKAVDPGAVLKWFAVRAGPCSMGAIPLGTGCEAPVHLISMQGLDHHDPPFNTSLDIATRHRASKISLVPADQSPLGSARSFPRSDPFPTSPSRHPWRSALRVGRDVHD